MYDQLERTSDAPPTISPRADIVPQPLHTKLIHVFLKLFETF